LEFDVNKVVEVVVTGVPPTLMALAAWRAARKNTGIAQATRIGVGHVGGRVNEVHDIVNGQREKLSEDLTIVREEVKTLREEIGGLKQEVKQLKAVMGGPKT